MSDTDGHEHTLPERLPDSDATGLDLEPMWHLVHLVRERRAFSTDRAVQGKNVLDYPPGFKFGDPYGLASGEAGTRWFHAMEPSYVVWAYGSDGLVYTVCWYSDKEEAFNFPNLQEPPVDVVRLQWLLRAMAMPLALPSPDGKGVVG